MRRVLFLTAAALLVAAPAAAEVETSTSIEADGTTTMVHSAVVAAPPADVWAAVATPEGWASWAVPLARWVPGAPDLLETSYNPAEPVGGPGAIRQQFLARIPGRLLAFRTVKAPDGFPHWAEYQKVTSIFEIELAGAGTRIRLTSTGYPDTEGGRALVGFFAKGNAMTLEQLQRRFAAPPR